MRRDHELGARLDELIQATEEGELTLSGRGRRARFGSAAAEAFAAESHAFAPEERARIAVRSAVASISLMTAASA